MFLSIFKSQMPNIIKRLNDIKAEMKETQENINRLMNADVFKTDHDLNECSLQLAIKSSDVPMWIKDISGCFIFVNKACCETILKCSEKEALGMMDEDFEKDALSIVCKKSDKVVLKTQVTHRWIEYAIYEDNHHVFLDVIKSPFYSDSGRLMGVFGNAINVSDAIPEEIKKSHTKSASIEIPVNLTFSKEHFIRLLERRTVSRPVTDS